MIKYHNMVQASNSRGTASRSIDVSGELRKNIMRDLWLMKLDDIHSQQAKASKKKMYNVYCTWTSDNEENIDANVDVTDSDWGLIR